MTIHDLLFISIPDVLLPRRLNWITRWLNVNRKEIQGLYLGALQI